MTLTILAGGDVCDAGTKLFVTSAITVLNACAELCCF